MDAKLRAAFRYHRRRGANATRAMTWARRDVAENTRRIDAGGASWGAYGKEGARWLENPEESGLRIVGEAHRLMHMRHTGWYTTPDGWDGETLAGVVLALPGRDGAARFLAGYRESGTGGICVDMARGIISTPGDDDAAKHEAARAADRFAEIHAERSRDYDEAWQAGARWRDLGDQIAQERRDLLAALAERRRVGAIEAPGLCALLRRKVADVLASIEKARAEREELREFERWQGDAWRDGAGA